jgi:hypothetical protein
LTTQQLQALILIIMCANAALIVVALVTMRRSRSHGGEQAELDHVATRETMLAMSMTGAGAGPLPSVPKRGGLDRPGRPVHGSRVADRMAASRRR